MDRLVDKEEQSIIVETNGNEANDTGKKERDGFAPNDVRELKCENGVCITIWKPKRQQAA